MAQPYRIGRVVVVDVPLRGLNNGHICRAPVPEDTEFDSDFHTLVVTRADTGILDTRVAPFLFNHAPDAVDTVAGRGVRGIERDGLAFDTTPHLGEKNSHRGGDRVKD